MPKRLLRHTVLAIAAAMLVACGSLQPGRAIHIATASVSHALCSGAFVSGQNPGQVYREEMRPEKGMGLIDWALRYRVDHERREVTASFAGGFEHRAVYREGAGCLELHGAPPQETGWPTGRYEETAASMADIAGPQLLPAADPRIRAAIDAAFEEPGEPPGRHTKAVVVVHRGRVIGERYAAGVGIDTPLHGHSITKSVTNALVGVLARRGRLSVSEPVAVAQWQSPGDARAGITADHLLRMSSGLPWDEYAGGWDAATRMWHFERDMYAFAARTPLEAAPGTRWNYSNLGYMVLARLIRDAAGGTADDVMRFAQEELFRPLGMRHVTIEFDATQTPIAASHFYASARDWARFGLLYLHDGMAGGRRILPEGWVRRTLEPTLDTGYGAGFWLNTTQTPNPMSGRWGMPGAPADTYFARGYLGQFVVIVPSSDLVVVRLGVTHRRGGDIASVGRLVGEIVAALPGGAR